jgi:methylmalonyl-CoA/ethylmalonyl-CoA epimerase
MDTGKSMIFDHIGIFVKNLSTGEKHLRSILGIERFTETITDPVIRVQIRFGIDASGIRYELVAPHGPGNPVDGVLSSGKNILNHVAYRVADIDAEISRLEGDGSILLGPAVPAVAFGGARVAFLFTPLKLILELIEDRR